MGEVTNEQVNLMLRLYEERREPKLREARDWFSANFHVKNADDLTRVCPPGSQGNLYMRMVLGYWEMVASIVNRGLIDEEFFFESNGEQWVVFEEKFFVDQPPVDDARYHLPVTKHHAHVQVPLAAGRTNARQVVGILHVEVCRDPVARFSQFRVAPLLLHPQHQIHLLSPSFSHPSSF